MSIAVLALTACVAIAIVLGYYVLLVPRIQQMLDLQASPVLLAFALASLLPTPPTIVMGVLIIFVWEGHRKTLQGQR